MSGASGVLIGPVQLAGFEIPESIGFGGQQRLAIHRFPGGGRVIDCLGPDDRDITWSGMMVGPDAADRARLLDELRIAGLPIPLVFGDMARIVLVSSFEAEYRRSNWIGAYQIRCVTMPQLVDPAQTVEVAIANDLQAVEMIDPTGVLPGVAPAIASASIALTTAGALTGGGATQVAFGVTLAAAAATVASVQAAAGLQLDSATTGGGWAASAGPSPIDVASASLMAEQLAKATVSAGLIGRAAGNLQGVS